MKTFEAISAKQALRKASQDEEMKWTRSEKRALQHILSDMWNVGYPNENGRNFRPYRGRIAFYVEPTENGYTVRRWL